jgi:hypothetical protein
MKKYITFDSVAYSLALLTFVLVASMLCSACMQLHERTHQKATNILDELEKPLSMNTSGYPLKTIRPKNHDNA